MAKRKPKLYSLLLLEGDLEVSGKLLLALHRIEPHLAPYNLDVTHLSRSKSVLELVNDLDGFVNSAADRVLELLKNWT